MSFPGLAVDKCYVGVLEVYENPRTLTMLDLMEVATDQTKLNLRNCGNNCWDCGKPHNPALRLRIKHSKKMQNNL